MYAKGATKINRMKKVRKIRNKNHKIPIKKNCKNSKTTLKITDSFI